VTDLLLRRTGNPSLYEVIADEHIVGRIALFRRNRGKPWGWIALKDGREPTYGFEASREAAMEAFARCWFGDSILGRAEAI
jgi:hypothetical protein